MTGTRLRSHQERVHWTGLHRLLDRDGFYDQDEAAKSPGEGTNEAHTEQEKLGL